MLSNPYAAHHRSVISNPRPWPNLSLMVGNNHAIVQIMRMRINIGIVGNRTAFMNDDFATIIKQNIFVDGAIVFNCQVVPIRNFHSVKNFNVLATVLEDVLRKHGAHAEPEPVIQPGR